MKKYRIELTMACLLLVCFYLLSRQAAVISVNQTERGAQKAAGPLILVDAGHGGSDPGMIGVGGLEEKGINLSISLLLRDTLEKSGYSVIMTREEDKGLYDSSAANKKAQDMQRRIAMIREYAPVLSVSIHQNSYPDPAIKGAQVFYYTSSVEGKQLAKRLQERLVKGLDPQNHRQAKANDSYYLLKKTACPIVIVECGFLSNRQEADLLSDSVYQERVAWNIFMGIMQELKMKKE